LKFKNLFFRLFQFFFGSAIFALPLRVRSLLYIDDIHSLGFFNEYAAFFVNLSGLLFLFAFTCFGIASVRGEKISFDFKSLRQFAIPFLLLLIFSIVTVPFAHDPILALLYFWNTLVFFVMAAFLVAGAFNRFLAIKILVVSFFAQSILAVTQYVAGGSLGFYLFGESFFSASTFNVAKIVLSSGETVVRGMGTLAHANIFGGLAALVLLFLAAYPRKSVLAYFAAVIILVGVFFSFSRAAALALFVGLILITIFETKRRIVSVFAACVIFGTLALVFSGAFLARLDEHSVASVGRLAQLSSAIEISHEYPLGVGRGGYTSALAEVSPELKNWQLQPVHNFFVLKIAEESFLVAVTWLGIFAFMTVQSFRCKKFEALAVVAAMFILANFDHYFTTSFSAEAMLWLGCSFVTGELVTKEIEKKHGPDFLKEK